MAQVGSGMCQLSRWHKLDPACISCPGGASCILHMSDVWQMLVTYGVFVQLMKVRSSIYQLVQIISCLYPMSGRCKLRMAFMSCPGGASYIPHVLVGQLVQVRSGEFQLSGMHRLDPASFSCQACTD